MMSSPGPPSPGDQWISVIRQGVISKAFPKESMSSALPLTQALETLPQATTRIDTVTFSLVNTEVK